MPEPRYALIIGISEYDTLGKLHSAASDAQELARTLRDSRNFNDVFLFPYKPLQPFEVDAERKISDNELSSVIGEFLECRKQTDGVLIYFAGHGLRVKQLLGEPVCYLAASNSNRKGNNAITFDALKSAILEKDLSSFILLLDCCHSGDFAERWNTEHIDRHFVDFKCRKGYGILAACRSEEIAINDPISGHGSFTKALLEILKSGEFDELGRLSFYKVADRVYGKLYGTGQTAESLAQNGVEIDFIRQVSSPSISYSYEEKPHSGGRELNHFVETLWKLNYKQERKALEEFFESDRQVGAFWIGGRGRSGQRWLVNRLWQDSVSDSTANKLSLSVRSHWTVDEICQRLGGKLGTEGTAEAIADRLAANWEKGEAVAISLRNVERLPPERQSQIVEQIWTPLAVRAGTELSDVPLVLFLIAEGMRGNCCPLPHVRIDERENLEQVVAILLEGFDEGSLHRWVRQREGVLRAFLGETLTVSRFGDELVRLVEETEPQGVLEAICDYCGFDWSLVEKTFVI